MSIRVEDVTYVYNQGLPFETVALDHVSFEIGDSEFAGIIGHTGSGKSTLIQQLNGILKPTSGRIFVGNLDITTKDVKMSDIRKKVGLVFQYPEYQLFEETVEKDVAFGPLNIGLTQLEAMERVAEALELVGLDYVTLKDRSPFELSGGQKRRVAIAGVIAMKPEILILDEPTAGLDPKAHHDILQMLQRIHREQNNTIILVSHNMGDMASFANQIIVMDQGKAVLNGTAREVYQKGHIIEGAGLSLPPSMQLMRDLKSRGMQVREDCLTLEDAAKEIIRIRKENRNA